MLSFSEYKTKQQLVEMVQKYDLDLDEIAEAMAYSPNHQLTEEMLNEFLGKALGAIGGAIKGAFQGAKDSWQGTDAGKKQAEKAVQDFYSAITKMGVGQVFAKRVIDDMQKWLNTQHERISGQNQQAAVAAQNQQVAAAAPQGKPGGTVNVKPAGSPAEPTSQVGVPNVNVSQPVKRAAGNVKAKPPTTPTGDITKLI
jgi:hypothetical protein